MIKHYNPPNEKKLSLKNYVPVFENEYICIEPKRNIKL